MALSLPAAATNVRMPDPYKSIDRYALGTASVVDNTGVTVDMSQHVTAQLVGVPTATSDMTIRVQVSPDGTNYFTLEDIVVPAGASVFQRWYTGWENVKITVPTFVASTVTLYLKRYPWQLAGSWSPVSIGP